MRPSRLAALSLLAASFLAPIAPARADPPPIIELPPVPIRARGPSVFTTLARSRSTERTTELRADLVREVPRTVRGAPF